MFLKIKNFFIFNLFWFLSVFSFIVLAAFFLFTHFYFGDFPRPFAIYQHQDGQKLLGDIKDIYKYGIFGMIIFLADFGLGYFLRNRINAVAVFLSSFNLIIQIILFIILMQIYSLN